jgi:hypothetical protein
MDTMTDKPHTPRDGFPEAVFGNCTTSLPFKFLNFHPDNNAHLFFFGPTRTGMSVGNSAGIHEDQILEQLGVSREAFEELAAAHRDSSGPSYDDYLAWEEKKRTFCISHRYDIGDQRVWIIRIAGDVDARSAALYCQFKCEAWFGDNKLLTNLGIASLLVAFYGFQHHAQTGLCVHIDMHDDREQRCGPGYYALMADTSLHREGLREAMVPHVIG